MKTRIRIQFESYDGNVIESGFEYRDVNGEDDVDCLAIGGLLRDALDHAVSDPKAVATILAAALGRDRPEIKVKGVEHREALKKLCEQAEGYYDQLRQDAQQFYRDKPTTLPGG